MPQPLDVLAIRQQFPALQRHDGGRPVAFFDGPAGSQVPQCVADAVSGYLLGRNANTHGAFATSRQTDDMLMEARTAAADLFGSPDPNLVVFGANMTSLTLALSRSLARTWQPGDEVVVTSLDHDANVAPWVLAAADAGVIVRKVGIRPETCELDLDDLRAKLCKRTRLVAVGAASNATGGINPVSEITRMAHEVGALVFVDAVHYAPHGLIDVAAWNCDFVACSSYKFFGPHLGLLWGRRDLLESLPAYQVRAAGAFLPDRWTTGTQNHEGIAGFIAAVDYLAGLGRRDGGPMDRRALLGDAFAAIRLYEQQLVAPLLAALRGRSSVRVFGVTDSQCAGLRVPTVSFVHESIKPNTIARALSERGLYVWDGNHYALELSETLGLEPEGTVRVGLLHYNTEREVARLIDALDELL